MIDISVGQVVGWTSDTSFACQMYVEGKVVAKSDPYLSILVETYAEKHPDYSPFVSRHQNSVRLVEGKN
jgi:hypothetical protein